ncbi:MAG: nitrate reductase associated protein [Aulosira sp. ZfuVER01]|nr:nitrate reductase associated protein [Aulosira sp. ZfuVER01]MDZ8000252.1 nitrate reductase associated protein [Aulosira sp. DedVER01a]MDZ8053380.1 nitrate reductase associated protein [Aulosira sp. ZfuCHP01]
MSVNSAPKFFQFEADFVASLRCIPMQVRFKLDTCGIKLKLSDWHKFTQEERQQLVDIPCSTQAEIQAYRELLRELVAAYTNELPKDLPVEAYPLWCDETSIPPSVQEKILGLEVSMSLEQWAALSSLERFVLIKLSRPSHENKNFYPALQEFHLA